MNSPSDISLLYLNKNFAGKTKHPVSFLVGLFAIKPTIAEWLLLLTNGWIYCPAKTQDSSKKSFAWKIFFLCCMDILSDFPIHAARSFHVSSKSSPACIDATSNSSILEEYTRKNQQIRPANKVLCNLSTPRVDFGDGSSKNACSIVNCTFALLIPWEAVKQLKSRATVRERKEERGRGKRRSASGRRRKPQGTR